MTQAQDPWETEELIPLNSGEVTVADSYFEEGKYGVQLTLVYRIDIPSDPVDFPGETTTGWYSCGRGWTVLDNGARIAKPDADPSRPTKIHASSNYGRLMNRVVKDLGFSMRERGLPTEAKAWSALRLHLQREVIKYEGLPAREEGATGTVDFEKSILLPINVLGVGSITGGPVAASVAPPIPAAPTPVPAAPAVPPSPATTIPPASPSVPQATMAQGPTAPAVGTPEAYLLSIVVGKSDIMEAKTAAVRDPTVAGNQALQAQILEHQIIERWFDSGLLVMVDGRIARTV